MGDNRLASGPNDDPPLTSMPAESARLGEDGLSQASPRLSVTSFDRFSRVCWFSCPAGNGGSKFEDSECLFLVEKALLCPPPLAVSAVRGSAIPRYNVLESVTIATNIAIDHYYL